MEDNEEKESCDTAESAIFANEMVPEGSALEVAELLKGTVGTLAAVSSSSGEEQPRHPGQGGAFS